MKLKDQVCSLELAKKLKKLGVEQESLFNWVNEKLTFEQPSKEFKVASTSWYSAFTVAELGEKLPDYIKDFGNLDIGKNYTDHVTMKKKLAKHRTWHISYWTWGDFHTPKHKDLYFKQISNPEIPLIHAKTEANARAKCLIYLIENKLIKKE